MTQIDNGGLDDLVSMCKKNGFDDEQTDLIVAMYEHLIPPIMKRYEQELAYAVQLWDRNDPDAKKMVRIACANSTIGEVHARQCIMFGDIVEIPDPDYINPADHIPNYPHWNIALSDFSVRAHFYFIIKIFLTIPSKYLFCHYRFCNKQQLMNTYKTISFFFWNFSFKGLF